MPIKLTLMHAVMPFILLGLLGCGKAFGESSNLYGNPSSVPFKTRNIVVPQIAWGKVTLTGNKTARIWTEGCDAGALEDTFLVLLNSENKVVAYNDDGGSEYPGGCSRLEYKPATTGDFIWEVWHKASTFDPTRKKIYGRVDVKMKEVDPFGRPPFGGSGTKVLGVNVRVDVYLGG